MDKVKDKKEDTVNSRIKKLRDEYLNLTQQEFADAIGLQRNTISVNENGGRNFSKSSLNRIAEKFNVNLDWLEAGEGEVFKKDLNDIQLAYLLGKVCNSDNQLLKRTFTKVCKLDDKHLAMFEVMLDTLLSED